LVFRQGSDVLQIEGFCFYRLHYVFLGGEVLARVKKDTGSFKKNPKRMFISFYDYLNQIRQQIHRAYPRPEQFNPIYVKYRLMLQLRPHMRQSLFNILQRNLPKSVLYVRSEGKHLNHMECDTDICLINDMFDGVDVHALHLDYVGLGLEVLVDVADYILLVLFVLVCAEVLWDFHHLCDFGHCVAGLFSQNLSCFFLVRKFFKLLADYLP
jgi:hypothetical protein